MEGHVILDMRYFHLACCSIENNWGKNPPGNPQIKKQNYSAGNRDLLSGHHV